MRVSPFGSLEAQLLSEIENVAKGNLTDKFSFYENANEQINDAFSMSNYNATRDPWYNFYGGIPSGGLMTDVSINRDIQFKQEALTSQALKIQQLISILTIGDTEAVASLIMQNKNVGRKEAERQAENLINAVGDNQPLLATTFSRLMNKLTNTVAYLGQMAQINNSQVQQNNQKLGQAISQFNA